MAKKPKKPKGPPGGVVPLMRSALNSDDQPGGVVPLGKFGKMYAPNVGRIAVAAAASDELLDLKSIHGAIALLEASNAVHWDSNKKQYAIDTASLAVLPPGYQQLMAASAARAGLDPLVRRQESGQIVAAAAPDENALETTLHALEAGADVIAHFKALFTGATPHVAWWGAQLDLTKSAGDALVQILKVDLKYLSALVPVVPHAALVLTLVVAAGSMLGSWIKSSNTGSNGVSIYLYLWMVPAVQSR